MDMNEIKSLAESQGALLKTTAELKAHAEKAEGEVKEAKSIAVETKNAVEALATKAANLTEKCLDIERRIASTAETVAAKSETLGEQLTKSESFQAMAAGRAKFARIETKAAILNAAGQNQPLVPDMRVPGIIYEPNRLFTIRDLLPVGRTSSNLVQYTLEDVYTNNAAVQATEGSLKAESGITFKLENAAVITLAHWIPVSRQVLDDAPQLESYVNTRLVYGLKLEEEDQLLNGNGLSGNLKGLLHADNNRDYTRGSAGDSKIDTLRKACTQAQLAEYPVDAIVMNWADWETIELAKATGDGQYLYGNPGSALGPQIWGKRVVPTNSIAAGTFLVGAFSMSAQLWDRMDAAVQISYEDGDNFRKNMATLLVEERLALTVYRPAGFIKGTF